MVFVAFVFFVVHPLHEAKKTLQPLRYRVFEMLVLKTPCGKDYSSLT